MKPRREFRTSSRIFEGRAAPRRPERQRLWRIPRYVVLGFYVLATSALLIGFLWIPQIRITSIVVQGTRIEDPKEFEAIAREQLEGAYWYVVPRNSIFLYPAQRIAHEIESRYPRVRAAKVGYRTATSIHLDVRERISAALWCAELGPCVFLDSAGFAFARAPRFSGPVFFEFGSTSTPPTVGIPILSLGEFEEFMRFEKDLAGLLMRSFPELGQPVGIELGSGSSSSLRIAYPEGGEEWRLIIKQGQNSLELLRNIELALGALRDDPKNMGKVLSYVDARLGQKLFSKFTE